MPCLTCAGTSGDGRWCGRQIAWRRLMVCGWHTLRTTLPLLAHRLLSSFGAKLLTLPAFGRVRLSNLPPWTYRTIGRLTRCSGCWPRWLRRIGTRRERRHGGRSVAGPCGLFDGHGCPSVAEPGFAVRRPYRVIVGPAFLSLPVLFEFLFPLGDYVSLRGKISAVM